MLCAPEMSSDELLLRMNARAITHFSFPGIADQAFTRDQLVELGRMVPPEWIEFRTNRARQEATR